VTAAGEHDESFVFHVDDDRLIVMDPRVRLPTAIDQRDLSGTALLKRRRPRNLAGYQRVAADSIRVTREIVAQPALRKYSPVEFLPGMQVPNDDEAGLVKAAGDIGTTIFHPVGTARMGRNDDERAVVDARLRVIGIDRLRIVDASVMPSITSGNTNSPTMMIAEKASAMILEDQKRL